MSNPGQEDVDGDGTGDACDSLNNRDVDGYGNACDGDFDQNARVDAFDETRFFAPDREAGRDGGRGTDMNCHLPLLDTHHGAQALDVRDQMPGRVVLEAGMGLRAAAAALIEQQHAILLRIEQPAMLGRAAGARTAMQEDGGLALGIAAHLPIDLMAIAGI